MTQAARSTLPDLLPHPPQVAASVRQTGPTRESVTLVHGEIEHEGFDLEPRLPATDPSDAELAHGLEVHADAMARERENYFKGEGAGGAYK